MPFGTFIGWFQFSKELRADYLALVVFIIGVCFTHIHQGHLAVDAVRYAGLADGIIRSGDWVNLVDPFTYQSYGNKPPLLLWIIAVTIQILGTSTFALKLPAVAFSALALFLAFRLGTLLAGSHAGYLAVFLLAFNQTFQRDMVDLTFEGMAASGTILLLLFALTVSRSRAATIRSAFYLGAGLLLLLQSKPPYVAFCALPIAYLFWRDGLLKQAIKSPALWLMIALASVPTLLWFIAGPTGLAATAVDNQFIEPFRMRYSRWVNTADWVAQFYSAYFPLSVLATIAVFKLIRGGLRSLPTSSYLFLSLAAFLIPIIILVDARPRYLLVPALGLLFCTAEYFGPRFRDAVSLRSIRMFCLATGGVTFVLFSLLGIRIHRMNPIIQTLEDHPELFEVTQTACITEAKDYHKGRRARHTEILSVLQFDHALNCLYAPRIGNNPPDNGTSILADLGCLENLQSHSVEFEELKRFEKSALITLKHPT